VLYFHATSREGVSDKSFLKFTPFTILYNRQEIWKIVKNPQFL